MVEDNLSIPQPTTIIEYFDPLAVGAECVTPQASPCEGEDWRG